MLGAQPISQQMVTYLPGIDYGTSFTTWLDIQNGVDTGLRSQADPQLRHSRHGRDLAAYTHVDVLFQAYFTAYMVLAGIDGGGAPLNPGNPYVGSRSQNGFGTFGGPDFSATLAEVATRALNAVWFQKWFVHLRPRPEATGGIVHLIKTGHQNETDVALSDVILNSQGLLKSFQKYGTWLLSLAYPEGSPVHPSYPTGHGVVAGACITVLKFFFDGSFVIPDPVLPASDGLSIGPYTGSDAGQLTVNGELNKLGHNVSFGHGIHAGIHWRSDTDTSLLLGEAVALSFLRDRAKIYNEPFTVSLTRFDGTTATISNSVRPASPVQAQRSATPGCFPPVMPLRPLIMGRRASDVFGESTREVSVRRWNLRATTRRGRRSPRRASSCRRGTDPRRPRFDRGTPLRKDPNRCAP
jgi:hypothetical protein